MDFYKKIVKTKDTASILSEKEYKCVSLQAITNEAIKENNKKTLKDLVDEINGHLADLRAIKDDKDAKNKEKCATLTKKFEECLVKIVNTNLFDVLSTINGQLQQLQNLTNLAIRDNNLEELKKLAERMERNIEIVKEIPEVKSARNSINGDEKILEVVNKYTSLLNKVLGHINTQKPYISGPILMETTQKKLEENIQGQETPPPIPNKVALNEVEERLKLMRQKRLNRLSTFVDQQTKLAEQRSRENSPKTTANSNKNSEILSPTIPEVAEYENTTRSSAEIMKPSLYKAAAQEKFTQANLVKAEEQTVPIRKEEKYFANVQETVQGGYGKSKRGSFGKGGLIAGSSVAAAAPAGKLQDNESDRTDLTKSFAEKQIENARSQNEKPKVTLKSSNSRTTPPRTPTQIRKIFNSFNACVLGANNNKSIEDLPSEFNSPFEQQLKTFQLKSTGLGLSNRLEGFKANENPEVGSEFSGKSSSFKTARGSGSFRDKRDSDENSKESGVGKEPALPPLPALPPRRFKIPSEEPAMLNRKKSATEKEPLPPALPAVPPKRINTRLEKPVVLARELRKKQEDGEYEEAKHEEKSDGKLRVGVIEKSASQSQIVLRSTKAQDDKNPTFNQENAKKKSWRTSLDYDAVMIRHNESDPIKQEPTDFTITIKRDSNTLEPPAERCSFSTFRSSTDSVKDENAIDNPLYGLVVNNSPKNQNQRTTNLSRQNSVSVDNMLISAKAKGISNVDVNTLNFDLGDNRRRVRRPSYRREQSIEGNRFIILEPTITKLEYVIKTFMGLKRDQDYSFVDRMLSKFYVKIDEVPAATAFDKIEKESLLERLKQASADLERRVANNEKLLRMILEEQVQAIGEKLRTV